MERVALRPPVANASTAALGLLGCLGVGLALAGLALGPVPLAPADVLAALLGAGGAMENAIVWEIRLPRVLLGIAVGASLAVAGAALQGVLRNPLADPGLIGVTGGASLGAVMTIVLGGLVAGSLPAGLRPFMLPAAAFVGAAVVIAFVFALARRQGETSVATLILAGVAVNAIAGAAIGMMVYVSDDQQLRDLTFWTMGALGGAGWTLVLAASALTAAAVPVMLGRARDLDLFQLGERAAFHAGLDVERSKMTIGLATAVAVGAVTAAAGPIGFIGLVAPHLVRLALGPRHGLLLPASMLTGIALVLAADLAVRLVVPPAEPPIGLATSLIGGPFFLWLLMRGQPGRPGA
ncbi:MAG: iron ABC transporter permease [Pseudomonadota bacterium]